MSMVVGKAEIETDVPVNGELTVTVTTFEVTVTAGVELSVI